jgi:hypothetical protein
MVMGGQTALRNELCAVICRHPCAILINLDLRSALMEPDDFRLTKRPLGERETPIWVIRIWAILI